MRLTSRTRLFRARRLARAAIHWITAPARLCLAIVKIGGKAAGRAAF